MPDYNSIFSDCENPQPILGCPKNTFLNSPEQPFSP